MPNWVTNIVVPRKPKEFYASQKPDGFDFNKIIPMPEDVKISSPCSYEQGGYVTDFQRTRLDPILNNLYHDKISQKDFVKIVREFIEAIHLKDKVLEHYGVKDEIRHNSSATGKDYNPYNEIFQGFFNLKRYGVSNWFDWAYDNWDVKWNASDVCRDDDGKCIFNTPWCTPMGIWKELAKKHDFTVLFADEDTGHNCGAYIFKNGECKSAPMNDDDVAYAFAEDVFNGGAPYEDYDGYEDYAPTEGAISEAHGIVSKYLYYWER